MPAPVERLSEDAWVPPWNRHAHLARYEWAAERTAGRVVLDAACGSGYGSKVLLERGARRVDGFDLAPQAVAEAQRRYGRPGAHFQVADVTRLPVPDHAYQVFLSFETIEHVADDRALLREAVRVVEPGGTFICSTPNRSVTNPGIPLTGRPYNPFHLREYTRQDLEELLRPFFSPVTFFGQSFFGPSYVRLLVRVGRVWPMLAANLHRARKVLGIPWEKPARHYPTPSPAKGEPEVLLAVCRLPAAT